LRLLYHGSAPAAVQFRYAVLTIDLAIIAFFIVAPALRETATFYVVDYAIAAVLAFDIAARALASTDIARSFRQPTVWIDIFILATLVFPDALGNLGFLRILRLWSLSKSGFLWRAFTASGRHHWRDVGHAMVNIVTFLFIVTGFVYTFFFRANAGMAAYVDALYFTVTTVTTTGYGDVTLPGVAGRLFSIAIMIVGFTLFVRLAQTIMRPVKVYHPCPKCALQRHDPDAVHCKACGHVLAIPDDGM
jgi:voltage-gated potassium channel